MTEFVRMRLLLGICLALGLLCAQGSISAQPSSGLPGVVKAIWIDSEADILSLDTVAEVEALVDKIAETGFNTVILDTKNMMGNLFYKSKITPLPTVWKGKPYPQDFDLLETVVTAAQKHHMPVFAGLNLFSEGSGPVHHEGRVGPAYDNPDWQAVGYETVCSMKDSAGHSYALGAINERAAKGISVFNGADGRRSVIPGKSVAAVNDGVSGKSAGRWVSAETTGAVELVFEWNAPVKINIAKILFVRGYPVRNIELLNGNSARMASCKDNACLSLSWDVLENNLDETTQVIVRMSNNSSAPTPVRVDEIQLYEATGKNVALDARVKSTANVTGRGTGLFVAYDANGKRTDVTKENSVAPAGMPIPTNGFIAVGEDKAAIDILSALNADEVMALTTATVMLPEGKWTNNLLTYVNPANPEVQQRQLDIIDEALSNYDIAGVILDRGRYDNFKVDFSDLSRRRFEKDMNVQVKNWPADIYVPADALANTEIQQGPLYKKWIAWRASVICDFMKKAKKQISQKHPGKLFGDYVGGWYGEYWASGVNWGTDGYDATKDYEWATPEWNKQGYAQILDFLIPGVYYSQVLKTDGERDKPEDTIEGGIELVNKVTNFSTRVIPGLYVPNLTSDQDWERAVRLCIEKTSGVMIFSQTSLDATARWEATHRGLEAVPILLE